MQIGSRWPVGARPPALPQPVLDRVTELEAELTESQRARWGWTLTWLERHPVVELDDGTVITWRPQLGEAVVDRPDDINGR